MDTDIRNYIKTMKQQLAYEMKNNKRGGIYGYIQRTMAYNSNRIEGSTLTPYQTASIFETGTINTQDVSCRTKDIEEMTGHFRMFNYVLNHLDDELSEDIIKSMHYNLKTGVFEDMANGFPCGEYKNRQNFIADLQTATPDEVHDKMIELLEIYKNSNKSLTQLAKFHAQYENIHPFQDGNGRTGRMILFKESLKNNMVPIIIFDEDKTRYKDCLHLAQTRNNFRNLTEFFRNEQEKLYDKTVDIVMPHKDMPEQPTQIEKPDNDNPDFK